MFTLSRESEIEMKEGILSLISSYLEGCSATRKELGLLTPRQVREELQIGQKTLSQWEKVGLKRYVPPINDSRKYYYRATDILTFLGGSIYNG
ncbi:TPA: MerR family transcriptional regulator [Streptococcus suis]|nr:MerR family transcriptional regulator [Streptococcus suis]HEM3952340.1 MerR family transcriptional regulator [Streptococcus suis]HEM4182306.1 MerR family transcriptional regulator [Streptococcus suis]HEM4186639.1 MerR family transcriptional regulator [Streptococcus suis]HEM5205261.1 MerR family transcriptional regulator [Streptococcus suis]